MESFDLAAGRWVVRAGVFLVDAEGNESGFEAVASSSTTGESCGVDEAVVSQDGGGKPLFSSSFVEGVDDDVAGDVVMSGD